MSSEARVAANKRNAAHSTGPKTPAGKAASSRNALKHTLLARVELLPAADREEYLILLAALEDAWAPGDAREDLLLHQIAHAALVRWRAQQLDSAYLGSPSASGSGDEPLTTLARTFDHASLMVEKVLRYTAAAERREARATALLVALQAERRGRESEEGDASDIATPDDETNSTVASPSSTDTAAGGLGGDKSNSWPVGQAGGDGDGLSNRGPAKYETKPTDGE
jgi:hypothetical protein